MIFVGILLVGLGILFLVARDFFWALTEMGNSFNGRTSERTELWEAGQVISGVVTIILGAVVICVGISENNQREADRVAPTQTAEAQQALTTTLQAELEPFITDWREDATRTVMRVNPSRIDVYADDLYYGLCEDGRFFVAVHGLNGRFSEDYVYLDEGRPSTCQTDTLRMTEDGPSSAGWQPVFLFEQRPFAIPTTLQSAVEFLTRTPEPPTATPVPATPTQRPSRTPVPSPMPEATRTPQFA